MLTETLILAAFAFFGKELDFMTAVIEKSPAEEIAAAWKRHDGRIAFVQSLFQGKADPPAQAPADAPANTSAFSFRLPAPTTGSDPKLAEPMPTFGAR